MDKIQMTEDQAKDIYDECVMAATGTEWHNFIEDMRDSGYIKKSDLEIARENYHNKYDVDKDSLLGKYLHELEKEIERLSK